MNSIWEYIVPTFVMAVMSAIMAYRRGKNPFLWFVITMIINIIGTIIISTYPKDEKIISKRAKDKEEKVYPSLSDGVPVTIAVACAMMFAFSALKFIEQIFVMVLADIDSRGALTLGWNILIIVLITSLSIFLLMRKDWPYRLAIALNVIILFTSLRNIVRIDEYAIIGFVTLPIQIATVVLLAINWRTYNN